MPDTPDKPDYDVFVCHASEDKAEFVDGLVAALRERGLCVWYDSFEIKLGDGTSKTYEVRNSTPGTVDGLYNGAAALAVVEILKDADVLAYING